MANALIDNTEKFKLVKYIKKLVSNPNCNHIMIATGYWDLPGTALIYDELKDFFNRGGKLDLLIGQEPQLQYYQTTIGVNQFPDFYIQRDIEALSDEYKSVGKLIVENALTEDNPNGQFEIRVYGQGEHKEFLHAKCYIFLGLELGTGIIGSSNFTQKGLEGNAELNYLEENSNCVTSDFTEYYNTKSHKAWFEELWQHSELWTGKFIKNILKPSPIGKKIAEDLKPAPLTPYELYIKYLQLQFGDMVDANTTEILKSYLPPSLDPLEYQLDAVKQCFSVMKRYGGFLLGDVVGLGKTVVGILLIRHFLENAELLGRPTKVLIITPPAIKKNWVKTIRDFDTNHHNQIEPCVTFVTTGSIGKITDELEKEVDETEDGDEISVKADNYGLILIDESHNFRNSDTQKYQAVNDLIGLISPTPFVALLSATPQNNSPRDIYNQIRLFQRNANNSMLPNVEGGKLDSFFNAQEKNFKEARAIPQDTEEGREKARKIIAEVSKQVRKCVLNDLLVRRTRTDIKKMYSADAEHLKFPTVKGPHKLEYKMDEELQQLFFDTTEAICPPPPGVPFDPERHIGFFRYAAITQFKKSEHIKLYEKRNLTVDNITRRLKRIMQILLVKRLESSIAAFRTTLDNLRRYTDAMIEMLRHDCVYICPDIDVSKIYMECEGDFDKFSSEIENFIAKKGGNNRRFFASDFKSEYFDKLLQDKRLIERLLARWNANSYDPKFERFKKALETELFAKNINNPSGINKPRLVIFTEAIDTLNAISRAAKAQGYKVLKISAKNRSEMQEVIERNFDANQKLENQRDDYNVIVTTEVLAEGVNLHRANVILNYDAPWNATRLMQRIGRVNRIGSVEEFVHVFNFFPSVEGNEQIRLIEKAYAKLQSFHEMFGEDNKVFSEREELCEHDLQEITDGEESPFAPFINELRTYRDENPDRYAHIASLKPDGLGGTINIAEKKDSIFVFTDNSQGYISVEVNTAEESPKTKIVSSLTTMQQLKCDPSAHFVESRLLDDALATIAKRAYQNHVAHYITQSDSSNKITDALAIIKELKRNFNLSIESKRILKHIEMLVRNNDSYVIKLVEKYKPNQLSLFGVDDDINAMIQASFANTASRATAKRGEASLTLYEIK